MTENLPPRRRYGTAETVGSPGHFGEGLAKCKVREEGMSAEACAAELEAQKSTKPDKADESTRSDDSTPS